MNRDRQRILNDAARSMFAVRSNIAAMVHPATIKSYTTVECVGKLLAMIDETSNAIYNLTVVLKEQEELIQQRDRIHDKDNQPE